MDSVQKRSPGYTVSMRLAVDIREACRGKPAGKGRWTLGFVSELCAAQKNAVLYSDTPVPAALEHAVRGADIRIIPRKGMAWHWAVARDVLRDSSIDAYVSTVSYIVPCIIGRKKSAVTIVHDLIAFRGEPHDKRSTFIERLTAGIAFRRSSLICTVSDTTRTDLLRTFPSIDFNRVVPIYAASDVALADHPQNGHGPVLCVGTLCPRKNQLRLIQAHASLSDEVRRRHPLVLVGGRGWDDEDIVRAAQLTDHVVWRDYVSDEERNTLLHDAVLFAFPSLYEGFGLPVLEAFRSGVPVLTSNAGSLKEIADGAALTVDPLDIQSIAKGLEALLTDDTYRHSFAQRALKRASDFNWKRTVTLFLNALSSIDKHHRRTE